MRGPVGFLGIVATTLDSPEDAALIVRAVNAFDALLAVAKAAPDTLDSALDGVLVDIADPPHPMQLALDRLDLEHPGWQEWSA